MVQLSAIKKDDIVSIEGRPCKVVETNCSNDEVHLVGLEIFRRSKHELKGPSTQELALVEVKRTDYELVDISADGHLSLMKDGDVREDIKMPEGDLGSEIRQKFDDGTDLTCTVLAACGEEQVDGTKSSTS